MDFILTIVSYSGPKLDSQRFTMTTKHIHTFKQLMEDPVRILI